MENRLDLTLVFPWVACQFCCGLDPGVIELLPVDEAITQCEHPTTEETAVPIRLGVEVSVSGGYRCCVIVRVLLWCWCNPNGRASAPDLSWSQSRLGSVNQQCFYFFSSLSLNPESLFSQLAFEHWAPT